MSEILPSPTHTQEAIDRQFMAAALNQADIAGENGDVPVGTVIVYENKIIAKGYNQRHLLGDPTAHAEVIALTTASEHIGNWRLGGCTIYVTLEPCCMCAGACVLARLDRLVFGCDDPKAGACGSLYNIVQDERLNHRVEITKGIMAEDCSKILQDFFRVKRKCSDSEF
jgi:tRNA(adenine34) deaminase